MKEVDPIKFGNRVHDLRKARGLSQEELGELSDYSQTNIYTIEKGKVKRPRRVAAVLSEALRCSAEYLLWGTGPKEVGPHIMSGNELRENYDVLPDESRAAITAIISEHIEAFKKKRKSS
jgi:transcriptional regulator with XRE-family HTH domain